MGQRGKKPTGTLKVVRATGERPKPPVGMSKRARRTWKEIVNAHPPGYFRRGSLPLLRAYCEAEAAHYSACEKVEAIGVLVKTTSGGVKANPAIAIQTAKSGEMATLAAKLRLCPSSYRDRDAAGTDGREQPKSIRDGLMFGDKK